MTICIAAICHHKNIPRIIICADRKESSLYGSAETAIKAYDIKPGWYALGAGSKSNIDLLVREYKTYLNTIEEITEVNIKKVMEIPLQNAKRTKAEEYIQNRYAITYEYFLTYGKAQFPDAIFTQEIEHIKHLYIDARLIIVGFTDHDETPNICTTNEAGSVTLLDNYSAIGDGDLLAKPTLIKHEYDSDIPLMKAIYYVLEAKRNAEILSSVGSKTGIAIINPNRAIIPIGDRGRAHFSNLYDKYHPKIEDVDFEFKLDYFDIVGSDVNLVQL